jgi:hypothetical protein
MAALNVEMVPMATNDNNTDTEAREDRKARETRKINSGV